MIITQEDELQGMKAIGRIVAQALQTMHHALEPGMTTLELDEIGRAFLEREGALSAPRSEYDFPGATCISVNEEVAHGIPGPRVLKHGDLVNIDVSASKGGYFSDTGASFVMGTNPHLEKLCRDGRRAMQLGINQVRAEAPLAAIGTEIGLFAAKNGYTLIRNLASHGIGRALHEDPKEISTWPDRSERRRIKKGLVLTVEPFLSKGAEWADQGKDGWTLYAAPRAFTVQYEHTVVATERGSVILTLPN